MPINYQPTAFGSVRRDALRGPSGSGLPLNATIVRRTDLNPGLTVLTIALNGWQLEPFEAGQYVTIALQSRSTVQQAVSLDSARFIARELISRDYSIASSPDRRDQVELVLNLVPRGEFTPVLWRLDEGSRLHVNPRVRGRFTLSGIDNSTHLVLIAAGTGLAPYLSMLRHAAVHGPRWESATLLHSVRHTEDLAYREELAALATRDEMRLTFIPTVTRPGDEPWSGETGRIQSLLNPEHYARLTGRPAIRHGNTHIFLCGNPEMIRDLRARFEADGFIPQTANAPGNLHFESYW